MYFPAIENIITEMNLSFEFFIVLKIEEFKEFEYNVDYFYYINEFLAFLLVVPIHDINKKKKISIKSSEKNCHLIP